MAESTVKTLIFVAPDGSKLVNPKGVDPTVKDFVLKTIGDNTLRVEAPVEGKLSTAEQRATVSALIADWLEKRKFSLASAKGSFDIQTGKFTENGVNIPYLKIVAPEGKPTKEQLNAAVGKALEWLNATGEAPKKADAPAPAPAPVAPAKKSDAPADDKKADAPAPAPADPAKKPDAPAGDKKPADPAKKPEDPAKKANDPAPAPAAPAKKADDPAKKPEDPAKKPDAPAGDKKLTIDEIIKAYPDRKLSWGDLEKMFPYLSIEEMLDYFMGKRNA